VLSAIENLGASILMMVAQVGRTSQLLVIALYKAFLPPYNVYSVVRQIHFVGARSVVVILISGATIGMVLGLQFHNTLERFDSVSLLGSAVALAVIRELGPVMTALMVVGRAGSAICAELGIMRTTEQIDALECMAISPDKFLVTPKLLAGVVSVPLLTSVFSVIAIFGGYFVGVILFEVPAGSFVNGMIDAVEWSDVRLGLVKSVIFGALITIICCAKGYYLHLNSQGAFGAEGVSRVTTDAVVISSITVLFSDYLIGSWMQ
jgi:phospholipid/cholesterol/gamma-HCH transport system permease protein